MASDRSMRGPCYRSVRQSPSHGSPAIRPSLMLRRPIDVRKKRKLMCDCDGEGQGPDFTDFYKVEGALRSLQHR